MTDVPTVKQIDSVMQRMGLGGAVDSAAMNLSQLQPGPVMPEKVERPYTPPDERGWCRRCSELTDQWYQRTLDQAKIRLCKRCKRESEAEIVP